MEKQQFHTIQRPSYSWFLLLLCYFMIHVLLRVFLSGTLDYDEAEQSVFSQWLLPGYTEQPPLYTWIQRLFFEVCGKGVLAVSLMKNILLFLTYVFFHLTATVIIKDKKAALLASVSLLLIPQICWESQRDMTHTVLVVCAAAATLYQGLLTVRKKSFINYLLLGFCLTIGFLAKANYAIFVIILTLSLLGTREGRSFFVHRYIVVLLFLPLILCSDYLIWMYHNQDIVFSAAHKFKRAIPVYWLAGPGSLLIATFNFLFPCLVIWAILFPKGYFPSTYRIQFDKNNFEQRFIRLYMRNFVVILLFVILLFKVSYVKDRWLQPLLFPAPIFFFAHLDKKYITPKRIRYYLGTCVLAAIIIYSAFTFRILGASWINNFSRMNYPFPQLTKQITSMGFTGGIILTNKRFLAGNMLLQFPDSVAIIPGYHFENQPLKQKYHQLLVLWIPDESCEIPSSIIDLLPFYGLTKEDLQPRIITNPYTHTLPEKRQQQCVKTGVAVTDLDNKDRSREL